MLYGFKGNPDSPSLEFLFSSFTVMGSGVTQYLLGVIPIHTNSDMGNGRAMVA